MTSHASANEFEPASHPFGILTALDTADGSLSLHSDLFSEAFHSSAGALKEANAKFVTPAQLERFAGVGIVRVLDVCVGLGYNSAALMEALSPYGATRLQWWGLELDRRPLQLALANKGFVALWSTPVLTRLQALSDQGSWCDANGQTQGQLLWGDARSQLLQLPSEVGFDLVLMDAFSPSQCPELWSEEFLLGLAQRLAPGGRLLTYSRAAAIRGSLVRAGLELRSLLPAPGQRREWSSGTLAFRPDLHAAVSAHGPGWQPLSAMEHDHLTTRAAIPYRDPSGTATADAIRQQRRQEQEQCGLCSTSSWQRRWLSSIAAQHQ
jgi:tRNA U34 5-methylaminomethyl-2-thiouridine-forming methyltransferase MnmC